MTKSKVALFALIALGADCARAQLVASMDDVQRWSGDGTNSSVLVLQWNDGETPTSLAWGYRWNGSVSGMHLLTAIAGTTIVREPGGGDVIETLTGADPLLELTIERYGFGDAIYSMVYSPGGTTRTQSDWDSGYWEYWLYGGLFDYSLWDEVSSSFIGPFAYNVAGAQSYSSVNWWSSQIGASDRLLVNGSWDAWSFAPGFSSQVVVQPVAAAVPEPRAVVLLLLAIPVFLFVWSKRTHA